MNTKNPITEAGQDNTTEDLREFNLLWNVPQDVFDEWNALPSEEHQSIGFILDSLLDEIDNTLAIAAINTKLFPVAASELKKRLKDFRLSLKDLPFPGEAASKKLH